MGTKKLDKDEKYISIGLKPSTKLDNGHYEILSSLGDPGGFGITYLGYDNKLNSKVAIKEYFPRTYSNRNSNMTIIPTNTEEDKADFQWGYNAFKKEAQTIANLPKHPNVIDVKNLFEENGTAYFIMSYTEGIDLERYLQENHPLSQKEIEDIIFPFLDGVKHIHKHNILHRDIKLANVLITKENQPILIDFGTARNELMQRSKKLTAVYTAGYAALEQHTQSKEGAYTDIYAIGMMMYALINGITETKLLPSSVKRFEALHSKNASLLTFPEDKRFTKGFINAVRNALEINKEDRPQNIQELIDLFQENQPNNLIFIIITTTLILGALGYYFYPNSTIIKEKEQLVKANKVTTSLIPKEENKKIEEVKEKKKNEIQEVVPIMPLQTIKTVNHIEEAEKAIVRGEMTKAIEYLQRDESSKTPKGALRIAKLYHALNNETKNAIIWYEKAEKLGYIKAQYPLAVLYCKYGNFTKFNNSKNIFEYAKDSRKEFKYDIGLCYNELGNIRKAREWFEASASMGYAPAKENLYTLLRGELGYSDSKARKAIDKL
jgi:serine/threonine protein kinase